MSLSWFTLTALTKRLMVKDREFVARNVVVKLLAYKSLKSNNVFRIVKEG